MTKDEQDIAEQEATEALAAESEKASENAQFAIAAAGKDALRDVQDANAKSLADKKAALQASSEATEAAMAAELERKLSDNLASGKVDADKTKAATGKAVSEAMDETVAHYVANAREAVQKLAVEIQKASAKSEKAMTTSVHNSNNALGVTEDVTMRAEDQAQKAIHFMDVPHAEVKKSQESAQAVTDAVGNAVLATKFTTQASESGITKAQSAGDAATAAKIASEKIVKKVMKTKAGIVDATMEVSEALVKSENSLQEAKAAMFQAEKLSKMK